MRRELGLEDGVTVVLYAGRVCAQKQPQVFGKTLERLRASGASFAAVVAGDGPDLAWLRGFASKHHLDDRLRLLGAVSNERMRQLMAAADVFFLPSAWEGIALSIYEAMASGLPIVGAEVGGQCELVTPECGVLVPRGDEDAEARQYAEVLAALLESPERRALMGQAARQRVAWHFRLEHMAERMAALLAEAQQYHAVNPRPVPGHGLGRACAAHAVEYVRLSQLADRLWAERTSVGPIHHAVGTLDWRARMYLALYRWHEPVYRWYTRRGWVWLTPVREKVKHALMGAA
jgi:hypothetical protein